MKVLKVQQIPNLVKTIAIAAPLMLAAPAIRAQNFEQKADVFEKTNTVNIQNKNTSLLEVEPIVIGDEDIYPALVIDKAQGNLYHYDLECYLLDSHQISNNNNLSGLKPGLKRIKSIEKDSDSINNELKNVQNKLVLENINLKSGKVIGTDYIYISEDNKSKSANKLKNTINLPKENLDFFFDNLYKEQYILIK